MNDTQASVLGYGLGTAAVAGLIYAGFFYKADADYMTLISSARAQLQLVGSMPVNTKDGAPNPVREKLLRDIKSSLDKARAQNPDDVLGYEYAAMHAYLGQDYSGAAEIYAQATRAESCSPEVRETMILNQARMLRFAHQTDRAVALLKAEEEGFSASNRALIQVEKMLCLDVAGRPQEAVGVARALGQNAKAPKALMEAAHYLVRSKQLAEADRVFAKAASADPTANYYRARLKIDARQIDTGLDLLEAALQKDPVTVRSMLRKDRRSWASCEAEERFQKLLLPVSPPAAPAGR